MRHLLDNDVFFAAMYEKHVLHKQCRAWLDRAKPGGWAVAAETYLAAVRLLMNPLVLRSGHLTGPEAVEAVEAELAGKHPGRVVIARSRPQADMLKRATGHKQVMDFWLVQIASEHGCKLATNDAALVAAWPDLVERIT
ncbi:MAG TPA: PIN domain-containing protein [Vicinamibacterales bacterium]|nr:PIN domain-containing protein [Vicinamibacterales bacterium]